MKRGYDRDRRLPPIATTANLDHDLDDVIEQHPGPHPKYVAEKVDFDNPPTDVIPPGD
jgi:hypothetical protein